MHADTLNYFSQIVKIVSNENFRPIPIGIIFKKLKDIYKNADFDIFIKNVNKLINSQQLVKLKSGKIVLGYPKADVDMTNIYSGKILINSKLSGFITLESEPKQTYFIHKTNLNGALDGDFVKFALLKIKSVLPRTMKDAKVLEVISHKKNYYVGKYELDGKNYKVIVDDKKMYLPIKLIDTSNLKPEIKFLFSIIEFKNNEVIGKVEKIIGNVNDIGVDVLSIVYDNGIKPYFSKDVLNYVKNICGGISTVEYKKRINLTSLPLITIDPITSKDFDDAIYCKKNDNNFRLIIAIADVSYFVKPNSILDIEAFNRGCSIYLVNKVIPMLPNKLCDEICTFTPNIEKLAVVVDLTLNFNGDVINSKIYKSIIKSHYRFNYDEVNNYLDKKSNFDNIDLKIKQIIDDSFSLHKILSFKKEKQGYIDLQIDEPEIIVNNNEEPIEIKVRSSGDAQKIIEDFMVIANEIVAREAIKQKIPFVYRVHEKPNNEKIKTFLNDSKFLNFKIDNLNNTMTSKLLSSWIKKNKNNKNFDLISLLILKMMAKAKYDTKNIGHFGLASENYSHFTAPIRRYSDIIVHQLLTMFIFEKDLYTIEQRKLFTSKLNKYCQKINENEIKAIKTEHDVNSLKFAQYMSKHIGENFECKVISLTKNCIFVKLHNLIEGLIKLVNLKDDFYQFDLNKNQLIGKYSKKIITIGTNFLVKCISVNISERKIEFELIRRIE